MKAINLALMVLFFVCGMAGYFFFPEEVVTHFSFFSEADKMGSKSEFLRFILIMSGIIVVCFVMSKLPRYHNYLVAITPENKATQYKNSEHMLLVLNSLISLNGIYLIFLIYLESIGIPTSYLSLVLPLFFVSYFLVLVFYVRRSLRLEEKRKMSIRTRGAKTLG